MSERPRLARMGPGDIAEIGLADGRLCYARALTSPLFGFYRTAHTERPQISAVVADEWAFKIWIHNDARRHWTKVGRVPLTPEDSLEPLFLHQDALSKKVSFYCGGRILATPAPKLEDVDNHEPAAVWEAEHVTERLRDHFDGKPNAALEGMRSSLRSSIPK